jgi:hypothetical protein
MGVFRSGGEQRNRRSSSNIIWVCGVVVLHETIHELRKRKQKGIIMKLDFEKAYDKVRWSLFEILDRKKFPSKWKEIS